MNVMQPHTAPPAPMPTSDTLDLGQAAEYLHLGYRSTKAMFDRGELPGVSLNQKHAVFLRADLERYLRELAIEQSHARQRASCAAAHAQPVKRCGRRRALPDLVPYEVAAAAKVAA